MGTNTVAAQLTYTTGQAAAALGVPPWKLMYYLSRGVLPEVGRCGVLRCWSALDVENARRILAERNQGVTHDS